MKITFDNIAGYKSQKESLKNLCMMINDYDTYKEIGVKLPKGLLLYGKPGVGKTLFAKAIANEINRKFIALDYSKIENGNINELIKEKFQEALDNKPSILFIDEINKLVTEITFREKYSSDKTRETETLLLSLIDGFNDSKDVLVIAVANNINGLSHALTRAGRIDRHVHLEKPDEESRRAIITYYLDKFKLPKEVDITKIVIISKDFTPAEIETAINESGIKAIQDKTNLITTESIIGQFRALESKGILDNKLTDNDREIVAYHELGHFIVGHKLKKELNDLSIINRPDSMGMIRFNYDDQTMSKKDVLDQTTMLFGGRAAEKVFFNEIYTGSHGDIQQAYKYVSQSVVNGDFGFEYITSFNYYSEPDMTEKIRIKIREILAAAEKRAIEIVKENKELLEHLYPILIKEGVITGAEMVKYLEKIEQNS